MKVNWRALLAVVAIAAYGINARAASTVTEGSTVRINGSTIEKTYPVPGYDLCKAELATLTVTGNRYCRTVFALKKATTPPPVTWTFCAEEGSQCTLTKPANVRYGVGTTWIMRAFQAGPISCTNEVFTDPKVGDRKTCQADNASAIAITPPIIIPPTDPDPGMPMPPGSQPIASTEKGNAFTTLRIRPIGGDPPPTPSTDGVGAFRNPCSYSHMSFDDPIVYPKQPGASHLHVFFGNNSTNAFSTTDSLFGANSSSCAGGIANLSAYWVPAMIDGNNRALVPFENLVYYKNGYNQIPVKTMRTPPNGLRFIGGNLPTNTGPIDENWVHHVFTCNGNYDTHSQSIPPCPAGGFIEISIGFPNCWDGINLDSPNHRSHMAYSGGGNCPASHPVAIPTVALNIKYQIGVGQDVSKWKLSSDNYTGPGGYSMHGDLWFNWQPEISETWMTECVRAVKNCNAFLISPTQSTY